MLSASLASTKVIAATETSIIVTIPVINWAFILKTPSAAKPIFCSALDKILTQTALRVNNTEPYMPRFFAIAPGREGSGELSAFVS